MAKKIELTDQEADLFERAVGHALDYSEANDNLFSDEEHDLLVNTYLKVWPHKKPGAADGPVAVVGKAISVYDLAEKMKKTGGACVVLPSGGEGGNSEK